jgi:urease accessory protein UreH
MASILDASDSSEKKQLMGASFRHRRGEGGGGALTGMIRVEKVLGRSVATTVYARYPLKYLLPSKVASSKVDCVWIYAISYGGGILSNDAISQAVEVGGDGCSVVITTQSSTKIYKPRMAGDMAQQLLRARVAENGFLALLPHPITCFRASRYVQLQEFVLALDASLLLVDWFTSGRIDSGETWDFELYRSTNHVFLEEAAEAEEAQEEESPENPNAGSEAQESEAQESEAQGSGGGSVASVVTLDSAGGSGRSKSQLWPGHSSTRSRSCRPLLLDCVHLENGVGLSIAERMAGFHVMAMVVLYGPRLQGLRKNMESKVEEMTKQAFNQRTSSAFTASLKKEKRRTTTTTTTTTTPHQQQQKVLFQLLLPVMVIMAVMVMV